MAAPMKRVVGWFDRTEWECVYNELYSDDIEKQQHGLDHITVWKCRLQHKLSMAIDVTSQLLSAQLQARYAQQTGTLPHMEQQLGMALALAVIRFVNLLTEKGQNRQYAQPIHVLANELGLPEWMVDLRHNATHAAQPGLPVLLTAVEFALSWLKEEYWEAQLDDSDTEADTSTQATSVPGVLPQARIADLLLDYMQQQYSVCFENGESPGGKSDVRSVRDTLLDIEHACLANRDSVMEVLTDEGYMCPTDEQLGALGISAEEMMDAEDLDIPEKVVILWRPLLKLFHRLGYTAQLLETTAVNISEKGSLRDRLLMGWLASILSAIQDDDSASLNNSAMKMLATIYRQSCDLDGRGLLSTCLKHPNQWITRLLPRLFSAVHPPLSSQQQSLMLQLCEIYTRRPSEKDPSPDEVPDIHTLQSIITGDSSAKIIDDEMEIDLDNNSNVTKGSEKHSTPCRWKLDTRVSDWSRYPLGICPGRVMTYTSLELPPHLSNSRKKTTPVADQTNSLTTSDKTQCSVESVVRSDMDAWSPGEMKEFTSEIKIF